MNRAQLEVILGGLALPAGRDELVRYAASQAAPADVIDAPSSFPDPEFASIDGVGEELEPGQPARERPALHVPGPESGDPPGGSRYAGS